MHVKALLPSGSVCPQAVRVLLSSECFGLLETFCPFLWLLSFLKPCHCYGLLFFLSLFYRWEHGVLEGWLSCQGSEGQKVVRQRPFPQTAGFWGWSRVWCSYLARGEVSTGFVGETGGGSLGLFVSCKATCEYTMETSSNLPSPAPPAECGTPPSSTHTRACVSRWTLLSPGWKGLS